MNEEHGAGSRTSPTPLKGVLILVAIFAAVALYIGIGTFLGLKYLYGGYLFALYWTGIKHASMAEFVPSLLGALGGLALAWAFAVLPVQFGTPGIVAAVALVAFAIYCLVMGWLAMLVNLSCMLYLTVAAIPALNNQAAITEMALSALLVAALLGGGVRLASRVGNRGR